MRATAHALVPTRDVPARRVHHHHAQPTAPEYTFQVQQSSRSLDAKACHPRAATLFYHQAKRTKQTKWTKKESARLRMRGAGGVGGVGGKGGVGSVCVCGVCVCGVVCVWCVCGV